MSKIMVGSREITVETSGLVWVDFMDMYSGGREKEPYKHIYDRCDCDGRLQ